MVVSRSFLSLLMLLCSCDGVPSEGRARERQLPSTFEQVLRLGALDSTTGPVFGAIRDVHLASDGSVFILDARPASVLRFSPDRGSPTRIGRPGSGPGEFHFPAAISVSRDTLYVLNRAGSRITIFAFDSTQAVFVSDRPIPVPAAGLCSIDDRMFVHGITGEFLFHELDSLGSIIRSFGDALVVKDRIHPSYAAFVKEKRMAGRILCMQNPPRLIWAADISPVVRAFGLDGEIMWQSELTEYHALEYVMEAGRPRIITPFGEGFHVARSLVHWNAGEILLQLELRKPRPASDDYPVILESRLISLHDGSYVASSFEIPFFAAIHANYAYGWQDMPFPFLYVYERGTDEGSPDGMEAVPNRAGDTSGF